MTRNQGGLLAVLTCVLLLAWLTAGSRPAVFRSLAVAERAPSALADPALDKLPGQAVRLREHLASAAPLASPHRNPFRFGAVAPSSPLHQRGPSTPPPLRVERRALPAMQLLGIAEDVKDGSPVRTAVISAAGQLQLVVEGDRLLGWQVVRIGADTVELHDGSDSVTLALK